MKMYNLGLVVGRFQTFHKGHQSIIRRALDSCDRVVVYIGSSQEANTEHNPFSYSVRKDMIEKVFPVECNIQQIVIRPLPDIGVGNNDIWGRYVLGIFEAEFHKKPDLYITGCEKERASWFSDTDAPQMDELRISRGNINVSASDCRALMLSNKYKEWCDAVPCELHGLWDKLNTIILDVHECGYSIENDIKKIRRN